MRSTRCCRYVLSRKRMDKPAAQLTTDYCSMPNPPLPRLAPRLPDSHKGNYGHALLVGGSRGMSGAIGLAGMAALRSGAGLVTVATAEACQSVVAGVEPTYMTTRPACGEKKRRTEARHPREA